ncbi:3-deoxy-7-phosphoheptulonate synthase class II [Alphaproteobacteria bacterium]|nr:3-deoxy-7-phosphoheptulonate synthase class II [Alphaproteobacteria bacterium]MDC1087148.1 3-deoxy-7-phosphoheptulonate synthase class II [Alphaproteobacteria bacterium]
MIDWKIDSWRQFPIKQVPEYSDVSSVTRVEKELSVRPPLIFAEEARRLRKRMADVAEGKAFLLQAGDCAESFAEHNANNIRDSFRVLLQMAVILTFGSALPVIKIGRLAGQYSKPRSSPFEVINDISLPSYRGDMVNDMAFEKEARIPDPERLIKVYDKSAATLNLLRAFASGGMADLTKLHEWNLEFVRGTKAAEKYKELAAKISSSLEFMKACGMTPENTPQLKETEFYTSHEGLLLNYEEALTRKDTITEEKGWFATSAHMLWIGDRTRGIDEAHVEYMRGIANPIGLKCGPSTDPDDLLRLIERLNPLNQAGRLTLIARMGSSEIQKKLRPLISAVKKSGLIVGWCCDPMHGNTVKASSGFKTRKMDDIMTEVRGFFEVHNEMDTIAGGVHFEMTGQNVTECVGGVYEVSESNLADRYHTHCDPRLNATQSLELAFLLADLLSENRSSFSNKIAKIS